MGDASDDRSGPGPELTVGTRVLVRRKAEADATGEVVEDYAALTEPGGAGHDWAPAHRVGDRTRRRAPRLRRHGRGDRRSEPSIRSAGDAPS